MPNHVPLATSQAPIGGYFEWEFPRDASPFPHEAEGVLLNSNRSAIQFILLNAPHRIQRVYLPAYTCESVMLALDAIQVPYTFYPINEALELVSPPTLQANDVLIYVNYFGIKDAYCRTLADHYGPQLIIDQAQAFYAAPIPQTQSVYSVRKFIGVPDGGIAIPSFPIPPHTLPPAVAATRCAALLARAEDDISGGYAAFQQNDEAFKFDGIQGMSRITQKILRSLDHTDILTRRRTNFAFFHTALAHRNPLQIPSMDSFVCPMVYPFYTDNPALRETLIAQKIFIARYWPNVLEMNASTSTEYHLAQHILPLPIDQRYTPTDLQRVLTALLP